VKNHLILSLAVELLATACVVVFVGLIAGGAWALLPIAGYLVLVSAELRAGRRPGGSA
jgi:hypothetical protein